MEEFKVGYRVKYKSNNIEYTISRPHEAATPNNPAWYGKQDNGYENSFYQTDLILISKNKNMNIKEQFILALTKEPQKSFRIAGVTNGDDILTEDGQKVFLSWLLHSKFAEEFKKDVVEPMLEETKKEKK